MNEELLAIKKLLFALNLVTLLMQIQYELNKILIQNALQMML